MPKSQNSVMDSACMSGVPGRQISDSAGKDDCPPAAAESANGKAARPPVTPRPANGQGRQRRKIKTLSKRLAERLEEPARDIPYAAQLAQRLRPGQLEATLGDVVVDMACMMALKGNATVLRTLWERSDGRPAGPERPIEEEPYRILLPLVPPGDES